MRAVRCSKMSGVAQGRPKGSGTKSKACLSSQNAVSKTTDPAAGTATGSLNSAVTSDITRGGNAEQPQGQPPEKRPTAKRGRNGRALSGSGNGYLPADRSADSSTLGNKDYAGCSGGSGGVGGEAVAGSDGAGVGVRIGEERSNCDPGKGDQDDDFVDIDVGVGVGVHDGQEARAEKRGVGEIDAGDGGAGAAPAMKRR